MRFGLSPDSSSLIRSSLPALYCSRSSVASCCFCASTVAPSFASAAASSRSLALVPSCSPARSRSARAASEIASSDSARVSAASSFSLSVRLMSRFRADSFCWIPARLTSAAAFCLLRSVGLGAPMAPLAASARAPQHSARLAYFLIACCKSYLAFPWFATAAAAAAIASWSPR